VQTGTNWKIRIRIMNYNNMSTIQKDQFVNGANFDQAVRQFRSKYQQRHTQMKRHLTTTSENGHVQEASIPSLQRS
jgi:hypothetical protein